jgi:putative ABC transport system ATP-binding protein
VVSALGAAERDRFRARHIGLVPQTLHLINVLSVRENLGLARDLAGPRRRPAALDAALSSLGIAALASRTASQLSWRGATHRDRPRGGEPAEPHPGRRAHGRALDDANCERAVELLRTQAKACGATLVVATHDRRLLPHFSRTLAL